MRRDLLRYGLPALPVVASAVLALSALVLAPAPAQAHHRSLTLKITERSNYNYMHVDLTHIRMNGVLRSAQRIWYNPAQGQRGFFSVTAAGSRGGPAMTKSIMPDMPSAGWTSYGSRIDTTPSYERLYSFGALAQDPRHVQRVYGYFGANHAPSSRAFLVRPDTTPPAHGSISVTQDARGRAVLTINPGRDAQSGVSPMRTSIQRRRGSWDGNACKLESGWDVITPEGFLRRYVDKDIALDACHTYRVQVMDRVMNVTAFYSNTIVTPIAPASTAPTDTIVTPIAPAPAAPTHTIVDGLVDYPLGLQASRSIPVTFSGSLSGLTSVSLSRRFASLVDGTCRFWSSWQPMSGQLLPYTDVAPNDGCYQYRVHTIDADGNKVTYVDPGATEVDTAAPTVTFEHAAGYFSDAQLDLKLSVTDAEGLDDWQLERRTSDYQHGTCDNEDDAWEAMGRSVVDDDLTEGHCYRYRLVAIDLAGNVRIVESPQQVWVAAADPTAPEAFTADVVRGQSIPTTSNGDTIPDCSRHITATNGRIHFLWQFSHDSQSGLAGYDLYLDGIKFRSFGPEIHEHVLAPDEALPPGIHTWEIRARNWAGLTTTAQGPKTILVDDIAPVMHSLTVTDTTIGWDAKDDQCLARILIMVDGKLHAVVSGERTSYTIPAANLAIGAHQVRIHAIDGLYRLASSETKTFTVTGS